MHHNLCTLLSVGHVLTHHCIRTCPECESYYQSEGSLTDELVDRSESVFCHLHLDVIVCKAYCSEPDGGDKHQNHVDITQSSEEKAWHNGGYEDDDASHCRDAFLSYIIRINGFIALGLSDIVSLHPFDEVLAKPY